MNDKELLALTERTFKGDSTALVRQLAKQLILERSCNKTFIEQMCRQRMRVFDMKREVKFNRVLILDAPAGSDKTNGDLVVYQDPAIELVVVPIREPWESAKFYDVLDDAIAGLPMKFRQMPGELSARYETTWTRWK